MIPFLKISVKYCPNRKPSFPKLEAGMIKSICVDAKQIGSSYSIDFVNNFFELILRIMLLDSRNTKMV